MRKVYLLLFCILIGWTLARAQQTAVRLFSANFQNATIEQVAADLQLKTGYTFYYDVTQFDSLRVTLNVTDKPLEAILDLALGSKDFHYTIIAPNIFLTKGRVLRPHLVIGFFGSTPSDVKAKPSEDVTAFTDEKEKSVPEATTENKVYEIGIRTNTIKPGNATLAGYLRDIKSGEPVVGASIYCADTKSGITTDQFGYYSINLPRGRRTLAIKGLGMKDTWRKIILYSDGKLNIELQERVTSLKEVKISAEKVANVRSVEMGVARLDVKSIKQIPTAFGEADVLRVILTLPGVQSVGEATTGFNVRGGSADQNLILLNDATIYNPAHFFGFFSAFNPDIVKDIELYKSSIPERFGGRLSSVLEVTNREGNKKTFAGSAGIGLLTSRINVEGPIIKDKTSFIAGARTTYSDWLLQLLPDAYKHSSAQFYDVNFDISHRINEKNNIYLTSYLSNDHFKLNSDTAYNYSNKNINLKWKHNFNNKLFGVLTAGIDDYAYNVSSTAVPINGYQLNFAVKQTNFKTDFTYYLNSNHTLNFGLSSIYYNLDPGDFEPEGTASLVVPNIVAPEQALESALYIGDKYDVTPDLSLNLGLRYSIYNYLGPQTVNYYGPDLPRNSVNVLDSTAFKSGHIINTYHGPEIRIAARYTLSEDMSVKASYNTLRQYIHLLSNSTSISPTDVYKLSDPNIKPQFGSQVSLGLYRNFLSNKIETSVEAYYKNLDNYPDFKSGASLLLNQHVEQAILNTKGKAYGVEFLIRKNVGKLNGWASYTYSRTFLKQDDPNAGEIINGGSYYPANYDKPHNFNFTGNYRFSHRFSVSFDVTYSTGRPITLPIAKYEYDGSERVYYSDRNAFRIPDYFRSDFSMNIDGNHKVHQLTHNSWTIGVYNLTGRANAYSTYFIEQGGSLNGYKLSIFARPIPFVNYNIRF